MMSNDSDLFVKHVLQPVIKDLSYGMVSCLIKVKLGMGYELFPSRKQRIWVLFVPLFSVSRSN